MELPVPYTAHPEERIECVAGRHPDGTIYAIARPARHPALIEMLREEGVPHGVHVVQGFLTDRGRFVTREQAAILAAYAGQITHTSWGSSLYSEDLW